MVYPSVIIIQQGHTLKTIAHISIRDEEGKANAKFIVKACNSHDELLEVFKKAVDELNEYIGEWQAVQSTYCLSHIIPLKNIIAELEQAIEKAEGKQ